MALEKKRCKYPDGTCQHHEKFEERRKHEGKLINTIPGILSVQNRIIGGILCVSVFGILFLSASFIYTRSETLDLKQDNNILSIDYKSLEKEVHKLAVISATNQVEHSEVIGQLSRLNDNLEKL